jgi:uncharacterized protein (DUF488 family)
LEPRLAPPGTREENRAIAAEKEILTVGHSNHEEPAFLDLLGAGGVEVVADVRANPRSRYPQFNRSALAGALKEAGIDYVHLGEQLGGRRESLPDSPNDALPEGAFRGYADHMGSDDFSDGIARLEELGAERRAAILCAEADWHHCHRRLLADALGERGWSVLHLRPDASLQPHERTEEALVENGRITYPRPQTTLDV